MSAIKLDYARFNSDSQFACYKAERDIIRGTIPNAKCTTNLMGTSAAADGLFPLGEGDEKNRRQNSGKHPFADRRPSFLIGIAVRHWKCASARLKICDMYRRVWRFYDALYRRHIPVDFIPADAGVDKLAAYP